MIKQHSISRFIAAYVSAILIVVLISTLFTTRFFLRKSIQESTNESIGHLLNRHVSQIENQLIRFETYAIGIALSIEQDPDNYSRIIDLCHEMLKTSPMIETITVARNYVNSPKMAIQVSQAANSIMDYNISQTDYYHRDWYQIPYLSKVSYWTEPWMDSQTNDEIITSYCNPIYVNGVFWGVVRLDLAVSYLQRIASSINLAESGYAILISHKGTIITHPADSLLMNESIFSLAQSENDVVLRKIGQKMISGETGFLRLSNSKVLKHKWIYYTPLISNSWSMGLILDDDDVFADLNHLLMIEFVIVIMAFVLLAVLLYYLLIKIFKPVKSLINASNDLATGNFDKEITLKSNIKELSTFANSFEIMRSAIKQYILNLNAERAAKESIETEVKIAADIQRKLIPANNCPINQSSFFRVYGYIETAKDVGGDLYDYFMLDEDKLCFAIADVMGNGIAASITMTMVSTLLRTYVKTSTSPPEILKGINLSLCESGIESEFVTMVLGVLDLRKSKLVFSNAGHVPLYIRKVDGRFLKYANTHSTALGIFPNLSITSETIDLYPSDEVILFTDGISEAQSPNQVFFGLQRLENILMKLRQTNPQITVKAILSGVNNFTQKVEQKDDLTLLVISFYHPMLSTNEMEN